MLFFLQIRLFLTGKTVSDVIGSVPLTVDEISMLYHKCLQYAIPTNFAKSHPYGVVLYIPEARKGCEEEADNFLISLTMAGYTTKRLKSSSVVELRKLLIQTIVDISGDCSLLFASIISHGSAGMLKDSKGDKMPINDILFNLQDHLPQPILQLQLFNCRWQIFMSESLNAI